MKALLVKTDNTVEVIDGDWNYRTIGEKVGGLIQAVYFGNKNYFAYVNEEGKILGLPENYLATNHWYDSGERILLGDYLAGDVLFLGEIDDDGNDTEVPEEIINHFIMKAAEEYVS